VNFGLHTGTDRLKSSQSEQVEGCRPQRRHCSGAVAPVAMGVLMQQGVADPVPALDAPSVSHQLQQRFWGGAQAGEKQMGGLEGLAITGAIGSHVHDPAGAAPGLDDVLRCLFGTHSPVDVAPVALLVIHCEKRDVVPSLELAADLSVQRLLVSCVVPPGCSADKGCSYRSSSRSSGFFLRW